MLKELPLGTSIFETLRAANEFYVDKTGLIYQLARRRSKCFLARPRRFGKSLLVSTFASLFRYGLRDFHGLDIESLWKDETYLSEKIKNRRNEKKHKACGHFSASRLI